MGLFRLTTHEVVESTNLEVKRLIDAGECEGAVVRAFEQAGGYGRQGRAWASPVGGVYQSILLSPEGAVADLSSITLVVGLAVLAAANKLCDMGKFQVKWPNDIVCDQGKVCGISSELYHGALCIGIGVNVFAPEGAVVIGGKNVPVYLADFSSAQLGNRCVKDGLSPVQRAFAERVGNSVLDEFESRYALWRMHGFTAFLDEYRAKMAMRGAYAEIENRAGGLIARGEVADIDEAGQLVLQHADGTLVHVASGEAHISKR